MLRGSVATLEGLDNRCLEQLYGRWRLKLNSNRGAEVIFLRERSRRSNACIQSNHCKAGGIMPAALAPMIGSGDALADNFKKKPAADPPDHGEIKSSIWHGEKYEHLTPDSQRTSTTHLITYGIQTRLEPRPISQPRSFIEPAAFSS